MKHTFKTPQDFEEFDEKLPHNDISDSISHRDYSRNGMKSHNRCEYDYDKARRWVKSFVGKHWDKMFSEWNKLEWIPKQFKNIKSISHIIEIDTVLIDGVVNYKAYQGFVPITGAENWHGAFAYVHPKTKLICLTKPTKKAKTGLSYRNWDDRGMDEKHIIIKPFHQIVYIDGIWFEIEFYFDEEARLRRAEYEYKDKPVPSWSHLHPNQIPKSKYYLNLNVGGWSSYYKTKTKHQLNSKQLKNYGLKNGEVRTIK